VDDSPTCCASEQRPGAKAAMLCPLSGTAGRPVELATVKALVTEAALRRITAAPHAFCADSACGTVYFAADGSTFSTDDIRVPVWQKQRGGNRMICYCFAESEDSIRREVLATGHTHAIERIRSTHCGRTLRVRASESSRKLLSGRHKGSGTAHLEDDSHERTAR
jgi:hypothetical protein